MADETPPKKSWLKVIGSSMFGLLSGAVLMYVSPLVNNAIKPSKPLANFAHEADGLKVTFHNRSTNASQGWWDFGDGSTLEPYSADQESIIHAYTRPGVYTAKLKLQNFLGDENERDVAVTLDGSDSTPPTIDELQMISLKPDQSAPATFRVLGQVKNAELSIWSAGDKRPLEVTHDPAPILERLVTFNEPGDYTIRLAVVNGKQTVESCKTVKVGAANSKNAHVILVVSYDAMRLAHDKKVHQRMVEFPDKYAQNTFAFTKEFAAHPGYKITEAKVVNASTQPALRNVKLDVAADKSKAVLTGELVKSAGMFQKNKELPCWNAEVFVSQEFQGTAEAKTNDPVVVDLVLPGDQAHAATTLIPLPPMSSKWLIKQRHLTLEVRDGKQSVWKDAQVPATATMQMRNKYWNVTVSESAGSLRLDVQEAKTRPQPLAN